jgi:hypothetical protein
MSAVTYTSSFARPVVVARKPRPVNTFAIFAILLALALLGVQLLASSQPGDAAHAVLIETPAL